MNYYRHYIGDFNRDTGHLSLTERGAYLALMHHYYATETPLPIDHKSLCRIAGAITRAEQAAVKAVMPFFHISDSGLIQYRIEAEIASVESRSSINKNIALAREEKRRNARKNNNVDVKSEHETCNESCNESSHETSTVGALSQPPTTSKAEEPKGSLSPSGDAPPCPHGEILALYHDLLPANPRIKVWDGERAKSLRTRWREDERRQSLDYWTRFFNHVAASPFLTGRVEGQGGRSFLPGLDWLVKKANFDKVIEGRYHDRSNA